MSISGVGASGSLGLDQILSRMLSRLDSTNATSSDFEFHFQHNERSSGFSDRRRCPAPESYWNGAIGA